MRNIQRDSVVKKVLENLCCSYGWSYGVLWNSDLQHSLFLTMQEAYYEEKSQGLIETLRPQVHMLGEGIIGQAAFTNNPQWISLDNPNINQNSSNSIHDMFLNEFDYDCQISSGIKTIAVIPLEPQGVLQFGSTNKIMETAEFVNQTKTMFQETENGCYDSIQSSNSQPVLVDYNQLDNWLQLDNPFNESLVSKGLEPWNSFPDFGIPDDFDISQWIPPSPDLHQQLMPFINESQLNLNPHKSNNDVGPRNGLFSNLGIDELLEGISSTSSAMPSEAKRRKIGNSILEMSYGMNRLSNGSQTKKEEEPLKAKKKKAKQGIRPRPKDRQQILDRMAELRELIPKGDKMSIDCLLDRTIKHMLFLQSVTKHADIIRHAFDKLKGNKDDDPSLNGATWAYELGNQTMVCPLIVEDLSTPGQMLIEIYCEDHGFFLEMVDVIRGFGVTILKGVLEVRDKIWGRFIVEAEAKRHVTRHQIFSDLVQLIQVTCVNGSQVHSKVMEEKNQLVDNYQQFLVQLPISLAETDYCINL